MLDVNVVAREEEVRLVLPMLLRRRRRLVRVFVPEFDAVLRQVVRDLKFLEALDQDPAQRPQLDVSNVLLVLVKGVEIECRLVRRVMVDGR